MKGKAVSQFNEHIYLHLLLTIVLLCIIISIFPKRIIIFNGHIFVRQISIIINTIINNFFYSMNYTYYYRLSFWSLWPSINNTQKSLNGSIAMSTSNYVMNVYYDYYYSHCTVYMYLVNYSYNSKLNPRNPLLISMQLETKYFKVRYTIKCSTFYFLAQLENACLQFIDITKTNYYVTYCRYCDNQNLVTRLASLITYCLYDTCFYDNTMYLFTKVIQRGVYVTIMLEWLIYMYHVNIRSLCKIAKPYIMCTHRWITTYPEQWLI